MSSRNFVRFLHRVDMYKRTTIPNDMGQERGFWSIYEQDVPCLYLKSPSSTDIRISPTTDETDYYYLYLDHNIEVDYKTRFKNIKNRLGNEEITSDWIEVIQINKEISFTGKIQYLLLKVKSVIE